MSAPNWLNTYRLLSPPLPAPLPPPISPISPHIRYAVNTADTAAGTPGVLIGRYPGDTYAGGNPWVLSTAALAQLLYRAATYAHASTDQYVFWK